MPKVIIGLHGLGNKPPKDLLEQWWKAAICEGLEKTAAADKDPPFELIYWADIVYPKPLDPLITDREDPLFLEEKYTRSRNEKDTEDHSLRKKVIDFMKSEMEKIFLNEDFSINYSFIPNAIMHRFFRDLESYYSDDFTEEKGGRGHSPVTVREVIRQRAADILNKHRGDEIMLIAHSMGTIIAYDVLNVLLPDLEINTLITIGSPLGLPVAKSKIAAENKNTLNEFRKLVVPPGVRRWYNYADIEDFVTINYDLADDFHAGESGVTIRDLLVHNDYEIDGRKNPHKSYGYLRAPKLSAVIASFLKAPVDYTGRKMFRRFRKLLEYLQRRKRPDMGRIRRRPKAA